MSDVVLTKRDDASERIDQMMRVMTVLHEKGVAFTDAMDVLRAFYGVEPTIGFDVTAQGDDR